MERFRLSALIKDVAMGGDIDVVLAADAQATIAALQARVRECDAVIEKQVAILEEINKLDAERAAFVVDLKAQLTQRTAERDTARRRVDELEAREVDVVLLRDDLEQRTAELEALQRERDEAIEAQLTQLQALVRVYFTEPDPHKWTAAYRTLKRMGRTLPATSQVRRRNR